MAKAKRIATRSSAPDSSYFTRLGMEVELQRLEEKAAQIRAWLAKAPAAAKAAVQRLTGSGNGTSGGRKPKRTMSADARRRISEAQKARWAKQKGQSAAAGSNGPSTPKPRPQRGRPAAAATPATPARSRGMKARHEM